MMYKEVTFTLTITCVMKILKMMDEANNNEILSYRALMEVPGEQTAYCFCCENSERKSTT